MAGPSSSHDAQPNEINQLITDIDFFLSNRRKLSKPEENEIASIAGAFLNQIRDQQRQKQEPIDDRILDRVLTLTAITEFRHPNAIGTTLDAFHKRIQQWQQQLANPPAQESPGITVTGPAVEGVAKEDVEEEEEFSE